MVNQLLEAYVRVGRTVWIEVVTGVNSSTVNWP
jgi:hypothetical protein